jgi:hypothetical protein
MYRAPTTDSLFAAISKLRFVITDFESGASRQSQFIFSGAELIPAGAHAVVDFTLGQSVELALTEPGNRRSE